MWRTKPVSSHSPAASSLLWHAAYAFYDSNVSQLPLSCRQVGLSMLSELLMSGTFHEKDSVFGRGACAQECVVGAGGDTKQSRYNHCRDYFNYMNNKLHAGGPLKKVLNVHSRQQNCRSTFFGQRSKWKKKNNNEVTAQHFYNYKKCWQGLYRYHLQQSKNT